MTDYRAPKTAAPLISALIATLAFGVTGCASSGTTSDDPTVSLPAVVTKTVVQTSSTNAPASTAKAPPSQRRTTPAKSASVDLSWLMPNEVGRVLQTAQDDIQRVSGDPVFFSHSHDAIEDRFQILDSDWKVCDQNVAPGARVGATAHIDFGVVKLDESCP